MRYPFVNGVVQNSAADGMLLTTVIKDKLLSLFICCCSSVLLLSCSSTETSEPIIPAEESTIATHPLDPLTEQEINVTTRVLKQSGHMTNLSRFASISLSEPLKSTVLKFKNGEPIARQSFAVIYEAGSNKTFEAHVDLVRKKLLSYTQALGSAQVPEDTTIVRTVVRADKNWQEAMHKRGITDLDDVYISVWCSAYLPEVKNDSNRVLKAIFYYQGQAGNAFLRPIEGVVADVDVMTRKVINLSDTGVIPIAPEKRVSIVTNAKPPYAMPNIRPSFSVTGTEVHWKNWRFRFGMHPREGLVLYTVSYDDHGKIRPILYRGSCSEACVPYADPSSAWSFRDAFDVGQFGLGANCDALEELTDAPPNTHFFDAIIANQFGVPVKRPRAIALYERDGGLLWKHYDSPTKHNLSVRGRDLVLAYITTLGNYDYGFNWIFHEDGSLEMETIMTGIMLAKGVSDTSDHDQHGHAVEKNIEAVHHQHFFCFRLDMDVDGALNNSLIETNTESMPQKIDNPYGNAFCMKDTKLRRELEARRQLNLTSTRRWKIVNELEKNDLGQPTGYMLEPGENSVPYSSSDSYVRKRAGFINSNIWATPYNATEMYAAGDYPFQSKLSQGLPEWTKADRSIENQDIVLWYTMGITHTPRLEEWPIMPVHPSGFRLKPNSFFSQNPALEFLPLSVRR
jgi:primary-amine oxidase